MTSGEELGWQSRATAVAGGLAGAVLGSLLLSAMSSKPSLLVALGLLAPLSFSIGVLCGLWIAFARQGSGPAVISRLSKRSARMRWLCTGPSLLVGWFVIGQLAVRLLGAFSDHPRQGGALLAMSTVGILVATAWGVDSLSRLLVRKKWTPSRILALSVGLGVPILGGLALALVGSTSGAGGPLALFGVFRREELDLVPVLHLTALAFLGVGAASVVPRFGGTVGVILTVATLVALGAGVRSASRAEFRELLTVERERGLGAIGLSVLRRITDRDEDGFAPSFGGGDCDDRRKEIFPGARDLPQNGIDEDCSGADAQAPKLVEEVKNSEEQAKLGLPERANFLLLTVDTLRWDLGYARPAGAPRLSPHLDELSRRSTVFKNAVALASYTSKSLAPMMLGRYASETHRTFEHFDRFGKEVPFVQETLQGAGIKTLSVQGYWYFFFKNYGFERGWDQLDSQAAPKHVVVDGDKSSNGHLLAERTMEHLGELAASKERFFLWTHWVDPHAEYVAHEEFDFGPSSRQRYDGEVAFVDEQIGRVLAKLEESGLAKNTVVMVTSDHGEAFSEHGMIRHGFEVWEELVRVPLLLHIPGASPREISHRRSLIDVTATILKTFGLEPPRSGEKFVRGTSLTDDALVASDAAILSRPVLVDMPAGPHNRERRAFYTGDLKLITSAGRVLGLYDLSKDPGEQEDLSGDKEKVASALNEMTTYLEGLQQIPARR